MSCFQEGVRCARMAPLFFGLIGGAASASTVELKAVAINGSPIPASSIVNVAPGDEVTSEILISDFADLPAIRTYQVTIDPLGWISGGGGALIPLGWDASFPTGQPCAGIEQCPAGTQCIASFLGGPTTCRFLGCTTDADCPAGLLCRCNVAGCGTPITCVGPAHTPEDGAAIDTDDPRFVHFGVPAVTAFSVGTSAYAFGSVVIDREESTTDNGTKRYAGTLMFRVSTTADAMGAASGIFVLGFSDDLDDTFLLNPESSKVLIPFSSKVPLSVNVVPEEEIIPTTTAWGLLILALGLASAAKVVGRKNAFAARPSAA